MLTNIHDGLTSQTKKVLLSKEEHDKEIYEVF
jgi:hypothetical protein